MRDHAPLVAALVADDLPGPLRLPPARAPSDDATFDEVLQTASSARVLGLMAHAVADGRIASTDAQQARCFERAAGALVDDLRREHLLSRLIAPLLDDQAVPLRVLKGPASAHLEEQDPALRSSGDIDLLVPGEAFDRAIEILGGAGWQRRFPEPRPGFDRRFGKGAAVHLGAEEVDLHRTLAPGSFGLRLPVRELWERPEVFSVGGRQLLALPPDLRLLHACYHAALGAPTPRLTALRDLVHLAGRDDVDVHDLGRTVVRWGGSAVIERSARLVGQHLGIVPPALEHVLSAHPPTARERRELAPYLAAPGRYARQAIAAVRVLPRWRDRRDYVLALAWPRRDYIAGRHRSAVTRWRSALRSRSR